ncbi:hypothetical protein K378_00919 [Streptomyces sp. Amel2xB2]|uniref:hypothetical protein n=1 Tax=Streptomyces sp. Amel2xB2 TaxID=1305829 RepID=UPI000DC022C2|nr:hypothetical protein [Streptomyces sp. Amel2xB2]RAJ69764.1 hypothetical protein K378_00919 [Streptomyces sp. Amel2xB2]
MSDWHRGTTPQRPHGVGIPDVLELARGTSADPEPRRSACAAAPAPSCVTQAGADWLASACTLSSSVHALWRYRPDSPSVLPCGRAFDVVSAPPLPGRLILERLWASGPGSGPVAVHRGRLLLFAAPGTAQRLPALLEWDEWRRTARSGRPSPGGGDRAGGAQTAPTRDDTGPVRSAETFTPRHRPPLIFLGPGDSVTIPALHRDPEQSCVSGVLSRWLVAPDVRHPWLPGPEAFLRACLRARRESADRRPALRRSPVRAGRGLVAAEEPISGTADRDAKVYDVTRRR